MGTAEKPTGVVLPDDFDIGWLAVDDRGCAWLAHVWNGLHLLVGLPGSAVNAGGVTLVGESGDRFDYAVGDVITGGGDWVEVEEAQVPSECRRDDARALLMAPQS